MDDTDKKNKDIRIDISVEFDPETKKELEKRERLKSRCGCVILFFEIVGAVSILCAVISYFSGVYFIVGFFVGVAVLCCFLMMAVSAFLPSDGWSRYRYL